MEILKKTENKPLSRQEITAKEAYTGSTPSRKQLRKKIADSLKVKEELVVIKKIENSFGLSTADITAYVYSEANAMKKIEPAYILTRGFPKEEPAQEAKEKPAEAKAAAEEPKAEDKPKEDKPEAAEKPEEKKKESSEAEDKK